MTQVDFMKLRYGNIIQQDGKNLVVTLVLRDTENRAMNIAVQPCITRSEAETLTLISKDRAVSFITGQTINEPE